METSLPMFSVWNERLGRAIQELGAPDFCSRIAHALSSVIDFDYFAVYSYVNGSRATNLFHNYPVQGAGLVNDYVDGFFKRDPLFQSARVSAPTDLLALRDGRQSRDSGYFDWYDRVGLGDEVGFGYRLDDTTQIVLSVARSAEQRHFVSGDLHQLRSMMPTVVALAARQWVRVGEEVVHAQAVTDLNAARVAVIRALPLTSREIEIVELILKGHSSEAIASCLSISLGTVKVHRRNIYQKLRISSQVELFHMCLGPAARTH